MEYFVKFFHYTHNPGDPKSLSNNYVTAIAEDQDGNLWIGTKMGINQLDPKTNRFFHYKHTRRDPRSISNNETNCIYPLHDGGLLVGTESVGDRLGEIVSSYLFRVMDLG